MGKEQKEKRKEKKKKKKGRRNTFSSRQNEFAHKFFFWRTFTQKFEGLKEEKLITKEKFLKFV